MDFKELYTRPVRVDSVIGCMTGEESCSIVGSNADERSQGISGQLEDLVRAADPLDVSTNVIVERPLAHPLYAAKRSVLELKVASALYRVRVGVSIGIGPEQRARLDLLCHT